MDTLEKGFKNTFIKGIVDFQMVNIGNKSEDIVINYFNKSIIDLIGVGNDVAVEELLKSLIIAETNLISNQLIENIDTVCVPKLLNNNLLIFTFFKKESNYFSLTIESLINNSFIRAIIEDNQSIAVINKNLMLESVVCSLKFDSSILPQLLIERIHPKDKGVFELVIDSIENSTKNSIDVRFLDFDNNYKWKRLFFRKIDSFGSDKNYYILIVKDIEYINNLENELMLIKQRFERILQVTRTLLWEVNSDGIFTYVSPNSELIWGLKPESIIGKLGFYDIHPYNETIEPKLIVLDNLKVKENELAFEYSYIMNESKNLWLFCFSSIDYDDDNFARYYGWDIDITDRKTAIDSVKLFSDELNNAITDLRIVQEHLEEQMFYQNNLIDEISSTKEELEKSNIEKDKFFSIIAHDLRSPFSGFLGLTKMLDESIDFLETDELKELAKMLKDSASITYALLENLLEWSRIQRNVINFEPSETNLFFLISNVVQLQKANLDKKDISVNLNVDSSLVINVDQNMINTVLRNLLSNAVKFTPHNGVIHIIAIDEEFFVKMQIKDSGIGMPDKIKENLFNIGAKTSREGTDGESSSGLGLLLCKEYVEKHSGEIWVESEENKGSTFIFTLTKSIKVEND